MCRASHERRSSLQSCSQINNLINKNGFQLLLSRFFLSQQSEVCSAHTWGYKRSWENTPKSVLHVETFYSLSDRMNVYPSAFDKFDTHPSGPASASEQNFIPLFKSHPVPSGLVLTCFWGIYASDLKTQNTWNKIINKITRNVPKAARSQTWTVCVFAAPLKLLKALLAFEMFMINTSKK